MKVVSIQALLLVLFLVFPLAGRAQVVVVDSVPGSRLVHGRVVVAGTNRSVQNPNILVQDAAGETIFGGMGSETGEFRFAPPTDGRALTLTVTSIGFATTIGTLVPSADGTVFVRVGMQGEPVELEGIQASARRRRLVSEISYRGFEHRMEFNRGTFFDRDALELRRPTELSDIIQRAPGFSVISHLGQPLDVSSFRSQGRTFADPGGICFPDIWLNGVMIREGFVAKTVQPGQLYLNDITDPNHVAGIEVYSGPAQIPTQFNGSTAMCGVIVIWEMGRERPWRVP